MMHLMRTGSRGLRGLGVAMVIFAGATCRDGLAPDDIHQLATARVRWASADIQSYHFEYNRVCFCLPEARGPAVVTVRNGVVTDVELVQTNSVTGEPILAAFPTIDDLFDLIQRAIEEGWDVLEVEYDEALGYPTSLTVDPSTTTADDESWYYLAAVVRIGE
jgi:Family of unknown function (DUF6174)